MHCFPKNPPYTTLLPFKSTFLQHLYKIVGYYAIQHKMPEQKWQIFLRALGAKGIEIETVTDSKVIFKVSTENLEHLRNLLYDKEVLKKNAVHALFNSEKNDIEKLEEYTYDTDILDKDISKLLNKLVSTKFIQKNNIDNILDKLIIEFDEKLLVK